MNMLNKEILIFSDKFHSLDTTTEWIFCNGKRLTFVDYDDPTPIRCIMNNGDIQVSKRKCESFNSFKIAILILWSICNVTSTKHDALVERDTYVIDNCSKLGISKNLAAKFMITRYMKNMLYNKQRIELLRKHLA